MPKVKVKNMSNKAAGSVDLPDEYFGITGRESLLHISVVNYLANQRQGTHSTKTRSKARGGGRKPYRQKGTGRARAGTIRSPIWKGGGIAFGPHPRDYSYSIPRQARRLALYAAISQKLADGDVLVVDKLSVDEPKTKQMVAVLEGLGLSGQSLLIVLGELDPKIALSARNIPLVSVKTASDIHAYEVLVKSKVLITKDALEALKARVMEK